MRPNIDNTDRLIFECESDSDQLVFWEDDEEDKMWVCFTSHQPTLWDVTKWWWRERKLWYSDVFLSRDDIRALHEKLGRYLED